MEVIATRADHPSGSDRLAEACALLGLQGDDVVVNVQGDEPLIDPQLINAVAGLLDAHPEAHMGTAAHPIDSLADLANPNVVKVVLDGRVCAAAPHRPLQLPRRFFAPVSDPAPGADRSD